MPQKWIKEPSTLDDTWANDGEHTLNWLNRSTLPRAKAMREFLNYNLSKLPIEIAESMFSNLSNRFHSAFFELILGRLLQEVGFNILHEVKFDDGKRPDFLVKSKIGEIAIEATSPVFNSIVGKFYKRKAPLIKIIREHTPDSWIVNIQKLPEIGFNDSKRDFKRFIVEEFSKITDYSLEQEVQIEHVFRKGILQLSLLYKPNRINQIGFYPAVSYAENSKSRIEHALSEKREQLKNIDIPVILAIQGSNTGTDLDDFDQVLFGHTYEKLNRNRQIVEKGFKANGKLVNNNKHSTYQAVLAFKEVGFTQISIPTLYINTNADTKLLDVFDCFHNRYYDAKLNEIVNIPAKRDKYLEKFKFVNV